MAFKYTMVPTSLQEEHQSLLDLAQEYVDAKADLESHLGALSEIDNVMNSVVHSLELLKNADDETAVIQIL